MKIFDAQLDYLLRQELLLYHGLGLTRRSDFFQDFKYVNIYGKCQYIWKVKVTNVFQLVVKTFFRYIGG